MFQPQHSVLRPPLFLLVTVPKVGKGSPKVRALQNHQTRVNRAFLEK